MAPAPAGLLSRLLDLTSEGTWEWDVTHRHLNIGDRWLEELGYHSNALPEPFSWETLVEPRDLRLLEEQFQLHFAGARPHVEQAVKMRKASGDWRGVLVRGVAVEWDSVGQPVRAVGTFEHGRPRTGSVIPFRPGDGKGTLRKAPPEVWKPHSSLAPVLKIKEARTAQKRAGSVRASARTVADSLPLGAIVTNTAGKCLYVNRAWQRITGYSPAQASGTGWFQAIHPEDRDRVRTEWLQHTHSRQAYKGEHRVVRADGSTVWVSVNGAEIREGDSSFGYLGVVEDISERRRSEDDLKRSRHFLQKLAESVPDLVYLYDFETYSVTYSNRKDEGLGGYPQEASLADGLDFVSGLVVPEDHPAVAQHRERVARARDGEVVTCQVRNRFRDGSVHWMHCRESVFSRDAAGRPKLVLGIATDVTPQKQLEQQLRSEHARLELAVGATNDIIFHCAYATGATFISPRFHTLVGATPAAQTDPFDLWLSRVHPEDLERVKDGLESMRTAAGTRVFEFRLRIHSGQYRWFLGRGQATRDENGEMTGLAGSVSDIHDRKVAEESLFLYSKDLEDAKARAEEADRAKSDFLAIMSHEIRTPMNGIIGAAHLLVETELSADQREYAEILNSSCDHLLSILNDILDFSKIEAGRMAMENVPFAVDKLLASTVALLQPKAESKKLKLALRVAPGVPARAWGDPSRIRQILLNLLGNAIKFTQCGSVTIDVEVLSATSAGCIAQFRVSDTGIGIARHQIPHLFQPFSQADASTTRRFGGTGLGLAISRRLVELMGGSIGVESREGQGSTFCFTLPLLAGKQGAADPSARQTLDGMRVLLISAGDSRGLEQRLSAIGLEAVTVPFAHAAATLATAMRSRVFHFAAVDCPACGTESAAAARYLAGHPNLADAVVVLADPPAALAAQHPGAVVLTAATPDPAAQLFDAWQRRAEGHDAGRPARTGRLSVLLAEDNLVNQKLAVRLLEKLECAVDVASNGEEAVAMWQRRAYDAIFMDCLMPVMDGFQATREIRLNEVRDPGRRRVPIFAFTANATMVDRDRCFQAGMDDFIAKPIRVDSLRMALETWVPAPVKSAAAPAG